ncbi:hypothetical protein VNO80_24182 [Phaseolus coccineus]|uniref:Exportin-1 C-terminal domain-containing protein n=1 Tax=Phaseolus coccineus TaxID=3886 RepID=A0AAN9QNY1_PHACN
MSRDILCFYLVVRWQNRLCELQLPHELCYVSSASQRTELIRATLSTLHAFLSLIPLGYIFESTLVASLRFGNSYDVQYVKMYNGFMVQLKSILPPTSDIPEAFTKGSTEEQAHIRVLESPQVNIAALLVGLEYLINISYVDDTEVCLEYWNSLVLELFEPHRSLDNPAAAATLIGLQVPAMLPGMVDGHGSQLLQRRQLYAGPMSKLRMLMICRMPKPEEVLIVEDGNGNIVRETLKENDVLVQYKIMRETLIYLSHLDRDDTEEQENRFLVMVIRDLLNLWIITEGTDNKAVIASNMMFVVGQYPRFLRAYWGFLKTVVNKLFEFMHETHPGVQDMACDIFLKIVQKCKREFVITQVGENEPFVCEILNGIPNTIMDLEPHQIHSLYRSVHHMIEAESDVQKRNEYLQRLMRNYSFILC